LKPGITPSNRMVLKSSLAIVFLALLGLPLYLERLSHETGEGLPEPSREEALKLFDFYLDEVSGQAGINFTHQSPVLDPAFRPILPEIASMGASVSVCDFDRDGWNDLYVTSSRYGSQNALYHNQQDGTFQEVGGSYGLADLNRKGTGVSMGAVWADFDNDGFEDVFIYKWGRPELFRNQEGRGFVSVTGTSGLPDWINANAAIWLDYNSDGLVDLFIGGYFPEDLDLWNLEHTAVLTESFEYAMNGGRNYLFQNQGEGVFEDVTHEVGLTSTRWTLAAGSVDVNRDGYPELIVANDYGIDEFYLNRQGEFFVEQGSETSIGFSPKSGMNVSIGDIHNQGRFGFYISNITEEGVLLQGNNFWVPKLDQGKLSYQNQARVTGIEAGGWSYGAQFGDLNNDGHLDLYLANGFISGKKGTNYWYDYSKVTGGNRSIISDVRNWPALEGRSHSGYQRNKVWLNTGSGFMYDVSEKVAGPRTHDSRSVAMVDLWNRGVLDVVVACQDDRLLVYKNHAHPDNNWIDFELKGTAGNKSAIGAIVKVYWEGQEQAQVITGGIGFSSQNQRRLHFGLGKHNRVDKVEILWPGGRTQMIEQPELRKVHTIIEN
jgi:hypothetical protein